MTRERANPKKKQSDSEEKPYRGIWRQGQKTDNKNSVPSKDRCSIHQDVNRDYQETLKEKYEICRKRFEEEALLERCKLIAPKASPMPLFYRTHAKMAVRASKEEGRRFDIGLFKPGTHDVDNMDYCALHKDSITRAVKDLRTLLENSELTPYDEASHSGDIRYLAIRASHVTEEIMVTVVGTSDFSRTLKPILQELKAIGHHLAAGYLNINDTVGNHIFGEDSRRLVGADRIRENLCELQFEIGPTSFFQVNPWQADQIYRRVEQLAGTMPRGATAWDLYCGTGTLSMVLARTGYRVMGIEENPQATRDAEANVRRNELSMSPQFMPGRVEDLIDSMPSWASEPSLIVANPSRRGMAEEALRTVGLALSQSQNSMMIYVSCEAETLIRDIKYLNKFGLQLRQLEAFDMFPYTEKLEWVAVLVKTT